MVQHNRATLDEIDLVDDSYSRRILVFAAIFGAIAVMLGAVGAHFLGGYLEQAGHAPDLVLKRIDQFNVGARYHLIHSVALLALVAIPYGSPTSRRLTARLFVAGIVLFSGSLYALVLTNTPVLGAITPIGGLCWIAGWLCLIWVAKPTTS